MPPTALHAQGNQLVDAAGSPFRVAGVSWWGMETLEGLPGGLSIRSIEDHLQYMQSLGFNTVRLPFSTDLLHAGPLPFNASVEVVNPGLTALTGKQRLHRIVDAARTAGLRVILDRHRLDATVGGGAQASGLWYDNGYTQEQWIADWVSLAQEYAGDPTVIGADLHNEPHDGAFPLAWSTWKAAAEACGNAILAVNPDWLILVEGVQSQGGANSYWWGGNLMDAQADPIQLSKLSQLVYSPHEYSPRVYYQDWFASDNFAAGLSGIFQSYWGYLFDSNIPVILGELGSQLSDCDVPLPGLTLEQSAEKERQWGRAMVDYLAAKPAVGWVWWSWNPDSQDTFGVLQNDLFWKTPRPEVLALIQPIMN